MNQTWQQANVLSQQTMSDRLSSTATSLDNPSWFRHSKLTGYSGELARKQWLLDHERLSRMKQQRND
ncbi:hypothetical protein [Stenomitos frigidus]|uniref:Uncharacterized protein n=1 Tax=Stenomitos frigidus ULC18 TaxID=2107698 RepID=A0A2T1DY36_9CYAN|nr:hypothetical protein [Stenomitos frigidus]PSB25407.1 hypothetical protein C7B82_23275 [Stenomitos frigidus ULC18]